MTGVWLVKSDKCELLIMVKLATVNLDFKGKSSSWNIVRGQVYLGSKTQALIPL